MDFSVVLMVGVESDSGSTIIRGQWRRLVDLCVFLLDLCWFASIHPGLLFSAEPGPPTERPCVAQRANLAKEVEMLLK